MNIIKTKQLQKGFTLIEVLLVIVLIGILIAIGLVSFNTEARFIDARNDIRKTHIQTLESAITQYKLQEGNYPTGLSRNYQEICDPEATDCTGFFDLKQFLVPNYLQAIPQDPNDTDTTGGTGYSIAVDEATNTVAIKAINSEGGVNIEINFPLPAEPTAITNTPLAATVPVNPIVTNGLVLHLDAGNPASYPGTGNTWFDLSGNGNNGTLVNGVGYNSDNGGSLVFDGVNDYVDLGSEKTLKSSGGWTVSSWINLSQVNSGSLYNFIGSTNVVHNSWYWTVYQSKLALWNRSPGGWYYGSTTIQPNVWYNCVLVSSDSGTSYQMYLNGVAEGGTHTTYTWNQSYAGLIVRYIGRGNSSNGRYFYGKYPQTQIYNRALTPAEIQQNFNATRGRFDL